MFCSRISSCCRPQVCSSLKGWNLLPLRSLATYKKIKPGKILGRKTFKERIMSPEVDGVNVRTHLKVAGLSGAGLGILCLTGLKITKRNPNGEKSGLWLPIVRNRVRETYLHLAGAVCMIGIGVGVCVRSTVFKQMLKAAKYLVIPWAVSTTIVTGWLTMDQPTDSNMRGTKHALWATHCLLLSAFVASVGGATVYKSAAVVATMALGLSSCAVCSPSKRFVTIGGPIAMGFTGLFASALTPWFAPSLKPLTPTMYPLYAVAVVSAVLLMYSLQNIVNRAESHPFYGGQQYDPINNAMLFVMDISELTRNKDSEISEIQESDVTEKEVSK